MAQWAHYSSPNEEFVKALATTPPIATPLTKNAEEAEQVLLERQTLAAQMMRKAVEAAGAPEGIIIDEKRIPVTTPSGEILIRTYTPQSQDESETFPVYVDIHGGGYCLATLDMDEMFCREVSVKHRVVVVNVDYRLAPQFPFPIGVEDSYKAVKWVASNAPGLRVDMKKGFIVGGMSAGANFACVITQRARSDPELQGKITGQVLQIPSTIFGSANDIPEKFKDKLLSYEQNKDDPILDPVSVALYNGVYKAEQSDIRASPLLAESFASLPPAYMQIAGADVLRDGGLLYNQFLEEAAVQTKLDIYPGVPHGFTIVYPELEISAKWRADVQAGIEWLLKLSRH